MTQTTLSPDDRKQELGRVVRAWDRRLRLQQAVRWFAYSLMPGLILGISLAIISRLQPFLIREQILNLTVAGLATGVVALLIGVTFYPRSMTRAAQKFDLLFGLNERVSTALELIGGKIRSNELFTERQLSDAVQRVQNVRARDYLPLAMRWQDWASVAVLAGVLTSLLLLPNPMESAVIEAAEANEAIEEAADDLREIQEDIAADPSLDENERRQLLEELDESVDTLEQEDITTEEAFAELSEVESELQQRADALRQQLEAQSSAIAGAQAAMESAFPDAERGSGEEGGEGRSLEEMLQDLQDELDQGANEERQQSLSEALSDAAEALQNANPDAAQNLQDAAENLQEGNQQQAQQNLQQGQQNLQQDQQNQQQQQQSQQNLQEGADQAQQSQQNLQQNQQQQGQQQQGQQGQQQQGQQQQGQQGQQQQGQQQQGQGQQQQGQQQQGQGQQGQGQQQSQQQGQQPGQGQQQGQSGQQGQQGQQGQPGQAQSSGNAGGAGDGESQGDQGGFAGDGSPMETNNNPDGEGESEFEPIYAPQRLGGQSDDSVMLESGDENQPLIEGEFSENPTGEVSVPYNEVFSDYSDAANQALENDYVPLGMEDVVRDYFTSIEPGQ